MKRLIPRLLALSVVLMFGVIAIAQAIRGSQEPEAVSETSSAVAAEPRDKSALKPVKVEPDKGNAVALPSDPFAASRFSQSRDGHSQRSHAQLETRHSRKTGWCHGATCKNLFSAPKRCVIS